MTSSVESASWEARSAGRRRAWPCSSRVPRLQIGSRPSLVRRVVSCFSTRPAIPGVVVFLDHERNLRAARAGEVEGHVAAAADDDLSPSDSVVTTSATTLSKSTSVAALRSRSTGRLGLEEPAVDRFGIRVPKRLDDAGLVVRPDRADRDGEAASSVSRSPRKSLHRSYQSILSKNSGRSLHRDGQNGHVVPEMIFSSPSRPLSGPGIPRHRSG